MAGGSPVPVFNGGEYTPTIYGKQVRPLRGDARRRVGFACVGWGALQEEVERE